MKIFPKFIHLALVYCLFCTSITSVFAQVDWAKLVVESTMFRYSPSRLEGWHYSVGFYLYSQYRVWQKVGDDRYFQYIKDWLDNHIYSNGKIDRKIYNLDNMQPGLITLYCYKETGEEKYKLAAENIRKVFDTYPRTSDGALWHMRHRRRELWLDGVYMSLPFLMKYGQLFGDSTYCYNEASNQIILYASHLRDNTGLLYHGYDEDGSSGWADPVTHRSPEFWGRSMGWFGMTIIEILEILPENHPNRPALIQILSDLIAGLANYQDKETGLWYQVPNKGYEPDNWLETSCSSMYTLFISKAVERRYVDSSYMDVAIKGYQGVLTKIWIGEDGLTYLKDICEGTSVGDYNYYINRDRNINDLRGLPAFILASIQMSKFVKNSNDNQLPVVAIRTPYDYSYFAAGSDIPIIVDAYDFNGLIKKVEFYENDNLLFSDTQDPWKYLWPCVAKGNYVLSAVAYDDSSSNKISLPVNIIVTNDSLIYQAEYATISQGGADTGHSGYTGAGFVDYYNSADSYVEWTLSFPKSVNGSVNFRYANGSGINRPCKIELNGIVIDSEYDFKPTESWENWIYSKVCQIQLNSGNNTLRVTALVSRGGPNIDLLKLVITK